MPRHNYLKKKEVATSIASEATTAPRSPMTAVFPSPSSPNRHPGRPGKRELLDARENLRYLLLLEAVLTRHA